MTWAVARLRSPRTDHDNQEGHPHHSGYILVALGGRKVCKCERGVVGHLLQFLNTNRNTHLWDLPQDFSALCSVPPVWGWGRQAAAERLQEACQLRSQGGRCVPLQGAAGPRGPDLRSGDWTTVITVHISPGHKDSVQIRCYRIMHNAEDTVSALGVNNTEVSSQAATSLWYARNVSCSPLNVI